MFIFSINDIDAAWIALWNRLFCAITGGRSETVSIPGGISILLKFDSHNRPKGFLILRDLRIFPRLNFADTYYAYGFRKTIEWNVLVAAIRKGPQWPLPYGFRWHRKSGRIVYDCDGELFSLSLDHADAIDAVIQTCFRRST